MRCQYKECKRKIINIECKCGKLFCRQHRLPFDHECQFNYKNEHKNKIKIQNPKIINKKIDPI